MKPSRLLSWLSLAAVASLAQGQGQGPQLVSFQSGELSLQGFLWRPEGDGPFPAVLYNHGSEKLPGTAEAAALPFARRGYVVFVPHRRGQGRSPGPYIADELAKALPAERSRLLVRLHEEQLADQLAALAFLRARPFVDGKRIGAYGFSFGGIQTMLGVAAPEAGYRAAVNCSGAAQSWAGSPDLQARLATAAREARAPVLFIQAENDYSLAPARALSEEMGRRGLSFEAKTYPPFGKTSQEGHEFCLLGAETWGPDVLGFLERHMR